MKKILIVDDEQDIVVVVKIILKRAGFETESVNSGHECLDKLQEIKPDLVLMDVMMRGISGWETCKKIKENKKTMDIPVLMLTVRASADSREQSFKYASADGHLAKPINQRELIATIEESLK